jgi:hypothetical protein
MLLLAAGPVSAQTAYPRAELFGGFSYLPADGNDFPRQTSGGFQASVSVNLNRWFGLAGDFGGQYSTASNLGPNFRGITADSSVYEYVVAPRFTLRRERVNVFVHGLIGGATGRTSIGGFSDSGLTVGGGSGVDLGVTSRVAVRAQFDLLGSFVDILEDNSRFGIGMVVRLGR